MSKMKKAAKTQNPKPKSAPIPLVYTVLLAMFAAVSIVMGKYLAFGIGNVLRFSFENLPIIFAAVALGPVAGVTVGVVADLVGCFLVGYTVNPLVTLGAAAIGLVAGIYWKLFRSCPLWLRAAATTAIAHFVGSVVIKTFGLSMYYDMHVGVLMALRLSNYAIVGAIEGFLIYVLTKNSHLMKRLAYINKRMMGKSAARYPAKNLDDALAIIRSVNSMFCNPGLSRTKTLCERLGSPEVGMRFIHVAGTNGKGSTSCMLASILGAAGYKVGLYTSPYIYRFNERIRVAGEEISDADIIRLTNEIAPIAETMADKPTEFESITAMAFKYFKERECDVVVLEVGLGGRYDATNIISAPEVSVITGISLDHTAFLGDTTAKIASEKAGIIKASAPVVWGGDDLGAEQVIREAARAVGSELWVTDEERLTVKSSTLSGTEFSYREREGLRIRLLGSYQMKNAMTVLDTVDRLKNAGWNISEEAIREGLYAAAWRARFEVLCDEPTVIYDGAHNPEGITVAVESIKSYYPGGRVTVISGVLRDKDYNSVAKKIAEVAEKVFVITPDSPRALPAEEYCEVLRGCGIEAEAMPSIRDAVREGIKYARDNSTPLFSLGSLYTYKDFVDALHAEIK